MRLWGWGLFCWVGVAPFVCYVWVHVCLEEEAVGLEEVGWVVVRWVRKEGREGGRGGVRVLRRR